MKTMNPQTINTFWNKRRPTIMPTVDESMTVGDQSVNIQELIKNGKLEEASEKQRKRFVFGTRIRIEDLTAIDHFKSQIRTYENLIRTKADIEREKAESTPKGEIEDTSQTTKKVADVKPIRTSTSTEPKAGEQSKLI